MSEKFVVGQWVVSQYRIGVYRVAKIDADGTLQVEGSDAWHPEASWEPFAWQVGRTYRTTLDGVTATVASTECGKLYGGDSRSKRYTWGWSGLTGLLLGMEKAIEGPHLLPYRADEPPCVAEAATYSEFAEADECGPLEELIEEFKQKRSQCDTQEAKWAARGQAWSEAIFMLTDTIERAKR